MKIIGITGSVASGKSFVAGCFSKYGVKVFYADDVVREYLGRKNIVVRVRKIFPQAVIDEKIDRIKLGSIVFSDDKKRKMLENILHPLVMREKEAFILNRRKAGDDFVVLEVPLLFETGLNLSCDYVVATICEEEKQQQRAITRGMTKLAYEAIRKIQISNKELQERSDFVINTSYDGKSVEKQVELIFDKMSKGAKPKEGFYNA